MDQRSTGRPFESAAGRILTSIAHTHKNLPREIVGRRREKRLRLRETLSLGEKRFLAVVQFDQQEFLVGGTGSSLALLARVQGGTGPLDPVPTHEPIQS
jgi:flagellar biogenesis protein FliO